MAHTWEKKRHFPPGEKSHGHNRVTRNVQQDKEREKFTEKKAALDRKDESETQP